jgi:serine phosphatase RsbU (regulator of sigma subunit)
VLVDDHRRDPRWPHVARAAAAHGVRSTLSLPLLRGSEVLGALTLHGRQPAAFGHWAVHVGEVLARQASVAVSEQEGGRRAGARLAVEARIARTLQRDLLPVLQPVPGMVTAGRYVGAEGGVEVGGDWYDVFPVPHGAVGLVIGDVMGHGLDAAHGMSQVRTALRVCAHDASSPAGVLDRLDRLVSFFDLALTTAVYGTLVRRRGGAVLRYCNAGHPPPLVRWPDGRVSQLDGGSSWLLGGPTAQLGPRGDAVVQLPSGAVLVLYTDGLVERREQSLDHGIRRLREALAGPARAPAPGLLCDQLLDAVCGDGCSDDLALLAVQVR